MITSYKDSNTEKEFNEKPMKDDHSKRHHIYIYWREYPTIMFSLRLGKGVTLAQLVKASVGQADVQRFEPHLGHN